MARNRHPFEGELARAKDAGRCRLWSGYGGEWVTRKGKPVYLPVKPLVCVARVPDLAFANRVIARRTNNKTRVKCLGQKGLTWDKQTGSWWLVTDF